MAQDVLVISFSCLIFFLGVFVYSLLLVNSCSNNLRLFCLCGLVSQKILFKRLYVNVVLL